MADDKDAPNVNEPLGFYPSRKITFYKSFEEENAAKIAYYASLTPVECMAQLNALLRQFYKNRLEQSRGLGTTIRFD